MTIFVPLFSQSLFEAKGDKEGNLVEAAVASIATMSSQLEWGTYYGLLMRLFKLTSGKGVPHQRAIVRAVCGVLERFHFFVGEEEGPNEERFVGTVMQENEQGGGTVGKVAEGLIARVGVIAQLGSETAKSNGMVNGDQKRSEGDLGARGKPSGVHAEEANGKPEIARTEPKTPGNDTPGNAAVKSAGGRLVPGAIQALLLKRVFPELRKSMIEEPDKKGDDGLVSTPVTLALVQVLALLPPRAMEVELPRLLHEVANLLKSRAQWVRDAARGAIVAAAQALGAR